MKHDSDSREEEPKTSLREVVLWLIAVAIVAAVIAFFIR